ncbi:MAG: ABC transporter substrate-binding protein [Hyphomicrobiaceae bacterium]|nr:ABC transporter substrate-binding protein [Hyphomicrobiaceae bacterium]
MMQLDRRSLLLSLAAAAAALPGGVPACAAGKPLRLGALKFGSLSWLLETMQGKGLVAAQGVVLDVVDTASTGAARIGLLAGDLDMIVSDWPWAMRQRSEGEPLKFAPFSSALGALMVPADSQVKTLADLKGRRIGVAGTSIDKSWVLLRAYSRTALGTDIAEMTTPVFGAAPLITEQLRQGRVDAALNFWTFSSRLKGTGYRELLTMTDVMAGLGIAPPPPLVGFVWSEKKMAGRDDEVVRFLAAVAAGNEILRTSDAAWPPLRDLMQAADDAELAALRDAYRAGLVGAWTPALTQSAGQLLKLLIDLGESELVGSATKFDAKLFHGA